MGDFFKSHDSARRWHGDFSLWPAACCFCYPALNGCAASGLRVLHS
ncbi:MAG: hypothetical protein RR499_04855 [Mucinivorans sp.]